MTYRSYQDNYFEARALAQTGVLQVRWSDWLAAPPSPISEQINLADKVEGMMLGLAVGDSLGNSSESLIPNERRNRYGYIENFLPNHHANGQCIGLPSDDTQMAFWTLEQLLANGYLEPQYLGLAFSRRQIFGIGKSVRQFLRNFKSGTSWRHSGAPSAGNGALMRIAPVLIPYFKDPGCNLWSDALLAAHLTHDDPLSNVSCVAFVDLLWTLVGMSMAPEPSWWIDTFAATCECIEPNQAYQPRAGYPAGFSGTLSQLLRTYVTPALEQELSVLEACSQWHSGAYLLESVPSALYILARHGDDSKAAILAAVNDTKDNDTIAAIVGAAVGALHGRAALPEAWIAQLQGRTEANDDGRIFELLARAGKEFKYGVSSDVLARVPTDALKQPLLHSRDQKDESIHHGQCITVHSPTLWVKVFGMLNQSWAAIDDLPSGGVRIWFIDDLGSVFDKIDYPMRQAALDALHRNGWHVAKQDFIIAAGRPDSNHFWNNHGPKHYSSGQYWIY